LRGAARALGDLMRVSLRTEHIQRYVDIGRLLIKHGRSDWVRQIGLDQAADLGVATAPSDGDPRECEAQAEGLADDLERMGPTFIKIGQLLSSRADLLPPAYLKALARLQDDVEPFPFGQVEQIVADELGVRLSRAFAEFEERPLAAASLGQVHRAVLRSGRPVVVKVQRPDIRGRIATDFDALQEIAGFIDDHTDVGRRYGFQRMLSEFRKVIFQELDYRAEASNLATIADNLSGFERIVVPRPVDDYCGTRVLTMDEIRGTKLTALSPVVLIEVDRSGLAHELFRAYLKQVLVDGFFHADPHPGNVYLTLDHRIALLDLGMVARLGADLQLGLLKLLLAISEGRGDDAADVALLLGERLNDFQPIEFRHRVAEFVAHNQNLRVENIQVGRVVLEIQRLAAGSGIRLPQGFTMLGKTLLNLDRVARALDPQFEPNVALRRNILEVMGRRMLKTASLGNLLQTTMETGEFVQKLPQRLNILLEALASREFKLTVDAIDEAHLLKGIHKVANRITAGLVLAALIVGAALLMRVETRYTILGYPALAMLLFMGAAIGGLYLVFRALFLDRRHEKEVE
jgi:ubiquinone biosynthesis protein